ncbi:hypothetical protein WICMUC_004899 [Wickerhamomyces mucosus]|uniref:WD repeat protein mio zinc-ribbon like domain-containing protein n=1 Tax=Wickerhamomyces mucosus TaxID=1378264 RepID=A0A9P8PEZ8_9ASCO|nr:hypothetical protein WICMUC_004899 [Wickerhamomyces mucosus]
MGKIINTNLWDTNEENHFVSINILADEVSFYKTQRKRKLGDEDIIKLNTRKGFNKLQSIDYSPIEPGLIAVGQGDGVVKAFDVSSAQSSITEIKQDRPCNAITFSTQGLLAVGFGKAKNENALHIFNINQYSKSSYQELSQPTFQFIQNESVTSAIFYNETNLIAGSSKFLRDIDIRVSSPVSQIATRNVHGITQDPFNPYHFAAYTDDGTLSMYDRRTLGSNNVDPLLTFSQILGDTTKRTNSFGIRYSTNRRGEFSTLHGGETIRRWQTGLIPSYKQQPDSLFVASVRDVKAKYDRVVSFDYCREQTGLTLVCLRQSGSVYKLGVTEGQTAISFNSINDLTFTGSSGTFMENVDQELINSLVNNRRDSKILNTYDDYSNGEIDDIQHDSYGSSKHQHRSSDKGRFQDDTEDEEQFESEDDQDGFYLPAEVLENDISVKMRRRAYLGYGTNCLKNREVIDDLKTIESNVFLRSTWRWLEIAQNSASSGMMTTDDLDLSFEGVLGIWRGIASLNVRGTSEQVSNKQADLIKSKILKLLSTRTLKTMSIVKSNKEPQRRLCMIVAGWYFSPEELEQTYQRLIKTDNITKAAGWAVFVGDVPKAVQILSSSKSKRLKLMATAISGYLVQQQNSEDNLWKDQCRKLSVDIDDPYLRAIFAYIADNDWWDVLDESSIPLRERLGVALRYLSDQDLTDFLNKVAEKYIKRGELEGLILTGITPKGIDLLQSYIDRTSDVQTAALITSFAVPKYFKDQRVDYWIESYRQLLNSWGMFSKRAKFDVARVKLSQKLDGKITLKSAKPGTTVALQCIKCNKNISKTPKIANKRTNTSNSITVIGASSDSSYSKSLRTIISCPHCGSSLPKCAICLLPLGKPLPQDFSENESLDASRLKDFKEWPSFCLSCNHGMHAGHAEEWFSTNSICPVPGCQCHCNNK